MTERPVAVVTGASSGIGAETAVAYAARGYAVVLAARSVDHLNAVADRCRAAAAEGAAGDVALVVPTDVTERRQVDALIAAAMDVFGRIDVMVNNAGYGQFARIHELDEQNLRDIFEVNFFGAFFGCRAVAPIMIDQARGHIFNISSVIGKVGSPFHGSYSASKFALSGLTQAMRVEMRPFGVHVTDVCPALTVPNGSSYVLYFGQDSTCNYEVPLTTVAGMAISPPIDLTGLSGPFLLTFDYIMETGGGGFWEYVTVELSSDGINFDLLADNVGESLWLLCDDGPQGTQTVKQTAAWRTAVIDITDIVTLVGPTIYVGVFFDSFGYMDNDYLGFAVDDICIYNLSGGQE